MTLLYQENFTGVNTGRGYNALIVYNQSGAKVKTNQYGTEAAVNASGEVVAVRKYNSTEELTVPSGGFVVSGHLGWDDAANQSTGGALFVNKIIAASNCRVVVDYNAGKVLVYGYPQT